MMDNLLRIFPIKESGYRIMEENTLIDILVLVVVLSLLTPIMIIQTTDLLRNGLHNKGSQVEKSMEAVIIGTDVNVDGVSRILTSHDFMMMIAVADYGIQDPPYLWLPRTTKMIMFDEHMIVNRQAHISAIIAEMRRTINETQQMNANISNQGDKWISQFRLVKQFGLASSGVGHWELDWQLYRPSSSSRSAQVHPTHKGGLLKPVHDWYLVVTDPF